MQLEDAGRRRRGCRPAGIEDFLARAPAAPAGDDGSGTRRPGSAALPGTRRSPSRPGNGPAPAANSPGRKRVQLLDPDDGDVGQLVGAARLEQVVKHLAAAGDHALHARPLRSGRSPESRAGIVPARARRAASSPAGGAAGSSASSRRGACAGRGASAGAACGTSAPASDGTQTCMFSSAQSCRKRSSRAEECSGPWPSWPCGRNSVRPQSRPHLASPELMNWSITTWAPLHEVAELALPDHEGLRVGGRIAVLEAEHGLFGQQRIGDRERAAPLGQIFEQHVGLAGRLVMQRGVAVKERAAAAVLAGEPDLVARLEQAARRPSSRQSPSPSAARQPPCARGPARSARPADAA